MERAIPTDIKYITLLYGFRSYLQGQHINPPYYYVGSGLGQIFHARLHTESSSLKDHLFERNLESYHYYTCKQIDSPDHFFAEYK